jgi:hypothetical protein
MDSIIISSQSNDTNDINDINQTTNSIKTISIETGNEIEIEIETEIESMKHFDLNLDLEIIQNAEDELNLDWSMSELTLNDDTKTQSGDELDNESDNGLSFNIKKLEINPMNFFQYGSSKSLKFKSPFLNDENEENEENQENDEEFQNYLESEFTFQEDQEVEVEEQTDDDIEEEDTLANLTKLVENQMEVRKLMLREIIKGYLKPFKENDSFMMSFVLSTIYQIKKIIKILGMENEVIVIIADILFNRKIVEDMQIYNYKSLLKPFLENSISQRNFLNYMLIFLNKNKKLLNIDNVNDIFQEIYSNKLVHSFTFINWYHDLNSTSSNLQKKLGIDFGITNAVFNYLEDIISNLDP